jgi:4-oxalomesaconate hydratase
MNTNHPQTSERAEPLTILMVGGHPADAFDNAGGTLVHHIEQGDRVVCAVLTTGVRSHANVLIDRLRTSGGVRDEEAFEKEIEHWVRQKNEEVVEACRIMGIDDLRFLKLEDDIVLLDRELIKMIGNVVLDVRPDVIITHWPFEAGGLASTHAVTGHAVLHSLGYAVSARAGDPRPPHSVAQVYFMGIPSCGTTGNKLELNKPRPDFVIDCTDVIERKIRALDCIKSQNYDGIYARKRIETNDGHYGMSARVSYGEPFMCWRPEVLRTLPLSRELRERANETQTQRFERACKILTTGK